MDLQISTSKPPQHGIDYSAPEAFKPAPLLPPPLPQPSLLHKNDNEPWRGSSAFGMANILNRSGATGNGSSVPQAPPPLPKFSLPSLASFGKPLMTKPEPQINRVRSILNEAPAPEPMPSSVQASTSDAGANNESSPLTTSQTPLEMNETPRKAAPSRRIAPAPTEDDDNGEEYQGGPDSIRGGRWSVDEHERFLAGFRIHGHKWKRVQQVVRTRSVTQVRTHAQKYLLKLAKLKGEKKPNTEVGNANSVSDTESTHAHTTAPEEVEEPSPRKKMRTTYDPAESVDESYIAAAATTLCFLMRQKIDSIFDSRMEEEKDLEPYDCYSSEQANDSDGHTIENARKRPYMHFITESTILQNDYSYPEHRESPSSETSGYSIDGKQLCS